MPSPCNETGKILMAGESNASGSTDFAIARYRRNGSLDPNFGYAGRVLTHFSGAAFAIATAVTVARDGKIVAAGWSGVNTTQTDLRSFATTRTGVSIRVSAQAALS